VFRAMESRGKLFALSGATDADITLKKTLMKMEMARHRRVLESMPYKTRLKKSLVTVKTFHNEERAHAQN